MHRKAKDEWVAQSDAFLEINLLRLAVIIDELLEPTGLVDIRELATTRRYIELGFHPNDHKCSNKVCSNILSVSTGTERAAAVLSESGS